MIGEMFPPGAVVRCMLNWPGQVSMSMKSTYNVRQSSFRKEHARLTFDLAGPAFEAVSLRHGQRQASSQPEPEPYDEPIGAQMTRSPISPLFRIADNSESTDLGVHVEDSIGQGSL